MLDDDSNSKDGGGKKKLPGSGFNKNQTFTLLAWAAIIALTVGLFTMRNHISTPPAVLSQSEFLNKFQSNHIASATINLNNPSSSLMPVEGEFLETGKDGKSVKVPFVTPKAYFSPTRLDQLFSSGTVEPSATNAAGMNLVWGIAPFLILGLLFWFFFIRQIKAAGKGALSFGKSKAKMLAKDRNKTTFKDVAGVEEAMEVLKPAPP